MSYLGDHTHVSHTDAQGGKTDIGLDTQTLTQMETVQKFTDIQDAVNLRHQAELRSSASSADDKNVWQTRQSPSHSPVSHSPVPPNTAWDVHTDKGQRCVGDECNKMNKHIM